MISISSPGGKTHRALQLLHCQLANSILEMKNHFTVFYRIHNQLTYSIGQAVFASLLRLVDEIASPQNPRASESRARV